MRAFAVTMPSGERYWTVIDEALEVAADADAFLFHVRFGRTARNSPRRLMRAGSHCYSSGAGRRAGPRMFLRLRARHRLREEDRPVDRASDAEIAALLEACLSARDRLIVLLMARAGLRRGEMCGLRRCDVHLMPDSRALGCDVAGAHLHVVRQANPNGAWAKSRRQRAVPLDFVMVQAFDAYEIERLAVPGAASTDFVLVRLFREPAGMPMPPGAVNDLVTAAGRRAGLSPAGHSPSAASCLREQCRRRGRRRGRDRRLDGTSFTRLHENLPARGSGPAQGGGQAGAQPPPDRERAVTAAAPALREPGPDDDGVAGRLAVLTDPAFLAEAGWDPGTRVLSLPAAHPLLSWRACPSPGCGNPVYGRGRECGSCRSGTATLRLAPPGDTAPAAQSCRVTACPRGRGPRRYWQESEPAIEEPSQVSLHGLTERAAAEVLFGLQQRTRGGTTTDPVRLRQITWELRRTGAAGISGITGGDRTQHRLARSLARHADRAFLTPESEARLGRAGPGRVRAHGAARLHPGPAAVAAGVRPPLGRRQPPVAARQDLRRAGPPLPDQPGHAVRQPAHVPRRPRRRPLGARPPRHRVVRAPDALPRGIGPDIR